MAVTDYLRKLIELKNQLVANLNSMGVTANESEKLNTLVPKVLDIETGVDTSDATATSFDIVAGKTAYVNGVKVTGNQYIVWSQDTVSNDVTKVNIPNGVTSIRDRAFFKCSGLTSITIPNSVTSIGEYVFGGCSSLTSITIGNGVTSIENFTFSGCTSLTSITIPNSMKSFGQYAFQKCTSLESITIPDSVKYIYAGAFFECSGLTSITIPNSMKSFGDRAFKNCSSLANIYYTGTEEQWNAITKGTDWNLNMGLNVSGGTVIHYNYVPE